MVKVVNANKVKAPKTNVATKSAYIIDDEGNSKLLIVLIDIIDESGLVKVLNAEMLEAIDNLFNLTKILNARVSELKDERDRLQDAIDKISNECNNLNVAN